MHRNRLLPLLALCLLAGLASLASAQPNGGQIGNLNPPSATVPNILEGDQSFAYLVFPSDLGFTDPGFILEAVHMLVDFEPTQIPQNLTVSAGLAHAVWDPSLDAYVPGDVMCTGAPVVYEVLDPGTTELIGPVGADCGCRPMEDPYFLIFNVYGPAEGDLVIDDFPQPGVVYLRYVGGNWVDMFGLKRTATGKSIIWGDIITCSVPIGAETPTWGRIKEMFR